MASSASTLFKRVLLRQCLGPLSLAACLGAWACDEKPEKAAKPDVAEQEPQEPKPPQSDAELKKKLGQALQPVPPPAEPRQTPTLEVLNQGAEPRRELRYGFQQGRQKTFEMTMDIVPSMKVNGNPVPGSPPMKFDISGASLTKEVKPDGTAIRETVFKKVTPTLTGVPPQLMQQLTAQMSVFSGMSMTETIDSRGRVLAVDVAQESLRVPQAQTLLHNLQEGMSNAFLPLPEQAVGPGAKWKGSSVVDTGGITVTQTTTFELKSLQGSKAVIVVTIEQGAKPQAISNPRIPPGASARLASMVGEGSGRLELDLNTLNSKSTMDMNMKVETEINGATMPTTGSGGGTAEQPKAIMSTTSTSMHVTTELKD